MIHRNIRHGIFETNSSSSHSITIGNGALRVLQTDFERKDDVITVYEGEFGWGIDTFYDAPSKASYCLTAANGSPSRTDMLREVLEKELGEPVNFCDIGEGYIDHQSDFVADDAFASPEALKHFIFDPSSVLVIDHDNH